MLCAWGIAESGERVLLSVTLGMRESDEDWLALGRDLTRRGLPCPQLIVADGAPGLLQAIEQCWPEADRQRCTVHRLRNLLAKLPKWERERVRLTYWQALDEAESVTDGERRMRQLIGELDHAGYTAAAACLAEDLDALLVHLKYPLRHRRKWRSTNLLERSLGEVRRRTKVIGRFPGETSCLSLCWAVLDLIVTHANRVTFTDLECQALKRLSDGRCLPSQEEVVAARQRRRVSDALPGPPVDQEAKTTRRCRERGRGPCEPVPPPDGMRQSAIPYVAELKVVMTFPLLNVTELGLVPEAINRPAKEQ